MERKSKKKVMAIVAAVVIVILVSVQGIILLLQKRYAGSQELSKIANAESEEMLASLTEDQKKEKMEELSKSWDESKVTKKEALIKQGGETKMFVPVPQGYTASEVEGENTVDGGFVIYEGTDPVTNDNKDNAQKTKNQWVWVPIYDVKVIYGTDSNGQMHGKIYDYSSNPRQNKCWKEEDNVMTVYTPAAASFYREPDLVTDIDRDNSLPEYLLEKEAEELEKELTTNFKKTINSIEKYGGFYIGRYETGGLSGEAKVVKQNNDISNQTWYTMYEKSKALRGKNRNVETSMIWGCLWDATLQWLMDTNAATYQEVCTNSSNWGNYNSSKKNTGSNDSYRKNNIYDAIFLYYYNTIPNLYITFI